MTGFGRWFTQTYLTVDRRVLGAFRILFGGVLVYDVCRRLSDVRLLHSNDGLLSNHRLLFAPQAHPQFSIYYAFSSAGEVTVAFALTLLVFVSYLAGFKTKVMQWLVLLLASSLNARNILYEDGGTCTVVLLAMWTLFLPLGDRYSIDGLLAEARLGRVAERVARRRALAEPVVSLAMLAITLQIVAIYWLNAVHKSGPTWRRGEAVHLVLWQQRIATPLARGIALAEPAWLSPLLTAATLRIERILPILVVLPFAAGVARTVAFALAVALHGGIALVMTLGPFSYAMICLVFLRLPPEPLAWLERRAPGRRLALARARAVRWLVARVTPQTIAPGSPASEFFARTRRQFADAAVVVLMVAAACELVRKNPAIAYEVRTPRALELMVSYPRAIQYWHMFARDAPVEDGIVLVDATLADGRHIDPFTGRSPDPDLLERGPLPYSLNLGDFLASLHLEQFSAYRRELTRYLQRRHQVLELPASERIVSFEAHWVRHDAPLRGSVETRNRSRELLFRWPE